MFIGRQLVLAGIASALWLGLGLTCARANDTTLNLGVSPPQLLEEGEVPVRMLSEHISIHFGQQRTQVEVEFTFRNLADYSVDCWAGFPDEDLLYRYISEQLAAGVTEDELLAKYRVNEALMYGETASGITNFSAWTRAPGAPAAKTALPYQVLRIESLASMTLPEAFPAGEWNSAPAGSLLLCRAFQLHLDPEQELVVGHSYESDSGSNVESQALFQYQLVTGRNWQGTIGEAVIDVFLKDDVAQKGLFFGTAANEDYAPVTRPGTAELKPVAPGHYRAVWRDFEPEGDKGWIYLATTPRWLLEESAALAPNLNE